VPIVLKSGSLNLLEPSGPAKACNGLLYLYVYNVYYLLLYTAEADRTIIARAQVFSTTSQNMDNELWWTGRGREKKSNIFFSSSCTVLLTIMVENKYINVRRNTTVFSNC
jgi:hypothetical protein